MPKTLLCPVFTSYPVEKGVFFKITSFFGVMVVFAKFRRCAESILFPRLTRDRIKTGPIKIRLIRSVLLRPHIKCGDKEILTHRQFPLIRRGSLGWQFLVRLPYTNKKIDTKNKFSVYLLSISYGILIGRFLNRELGNLRISPSRDLCRIRIECQRIFLHDNLQPSYRLPILFLSTWSIMNHLQQRSGP